MSLVIVIGRGHSGTRTISHTLYASGVYMGSMLNPSGDKVPPQDLYDACRRMARHVRWQGGLCWDFAALHTMPIDPEFVELVERYAGDVLKRDGMRGWKLPETTLVFPWIVRLFPQARYIYLVRDPRDCVIGRHITDDLRDFGIQYPSTEDERERRAISWKYQYEIVKATPQPEHFLTVRFEDFVSRQEETLRVLEEYLGIPLGRIVTRSAPLGRWRTDTERHYFPFFREAMLASGYTEGLPAAG
ncbi:MAG: sulfotransferase [Candidatus Latescibacterota bacterium]